jgi:uncharacterized glyoxalase superfamily protein PhnB
MRLNQLDVITPDVRAATDFLTRLLEVTPHVAEARFAEFRFDGFTLMLSPDALVDLEPARGVILHFEVDDVDSRADHARAIGATVAWGPAATDWGTYSALVEGPHGTLIDFYRMTT